MSTRRLLLLAVLGLIVTQAIFAKDLTNSEGSETEPSFTRRIYKSFMHFLFPGGIEEKLEENNYDLPKEIDELELNADAIFDQNNIKDAVKPVLEELTAEGSTEDVSEQVVTSEPKPKAATSPASLKDPEPSKSDPRKVIERKPSKIDTPKGRPINGFSVTPGPEVTANDNEHRRYKRSSAGPGIPDSFTFNLEATGAFASTSNFMIGSVIPYTLTIHASDIETDVKVEIFSERSGGAYFRVSNVQLGQIGSNFDNTFNSSEVVIRYDATFDDGRWDYVTVDLGNIMNSAVETTDEAASKIEVKFEMLALLHDNLVVGNTYTVSVGAIYQSESFIDVAQDELTYQDFTPQTAIDPLFSISGPSSLIMGVTGVWTIEAVVYDLYSDIALDVLAPLHVPGAMSIDSIAVISVGDYFQNSAVSVDDGGNFTKNSYENYGDYARLSLGTIINSGYHAGDTDEDKSKITFQVAITMLEHDFNETGYTIGFTIWEKDMSRVEIMWASQQEVEALNDTLPELTTSPSFTWQPSTETVERDGRFGVVLNMTIPSQSSARYTLEASIPMSNSSDSPTMAIEKVRISRIGFNMPHVIYQTQTFDGNDADFISWDLGIITNTGQRTENSDDDILQFEIRIRIEAASSEDYASGDSMPISLGMKHAENYYWVGRTSIVVTDDKIEYGGSQVPEFSFTNIMGPDAKIYPGTAAVYDLDMIVPAGVDYADLDFEASTLNDTLATETASLRIIDAKVAYIGNSLYMDGDMEFTFTNFGNSARDDDKRPIYTLLTGTIARLTNLKYENVDRYQEMDSKLRIRLTVVARGPSYLTNEEVYWTEVTLSFADRYIYAARAGVEYEEVTQDFYANTPGEVEKWQPTRIFELKEGETSSVPYGKPIFYNATIGIPYRTVSSAFVEIFSSNAAVQICRVKFLNAAENLVDFQYYLPHMVKGDVVNTTNQAERDIASNYKTAVSSYGYDYYVGDVRDSYLTYEAVIMLNENAQQNTTYSFRAEMESGSLADTFYPNITLSEAAAEYEDLPVVDIDKFTDLTDDINLGGSELYYLDIYVAPRTHFYYTVNIFAPWNSTFYGKYELLEVYVLSAGENLACYDFHHTTINVTKSSDNDSPFNNLGVVNLGYLPSLGEVDTETRVEANKIRIVAHVGVLSNSTDLVGELIPVAGTVDISGEHLWVGYMDSTVVDESSALNDNENNRSVELYIYNADGEDNVLSVGEVQHFTARITLPPGASYADFALNLESHVHDDESRIKIFDVVFDDAGKNVKELRKYHEVISTANPYGIDHIQKVDFKFARNTDLSGISDYIEPDEDRETARSVSDNEISFNFSVKLLDTMEFVNGFQFNLSATVTAGSDVKAVGTGETEITVETLPDDNAYLIWDAGLVNKPANIIQDTVLDFYLNLTLAENATRFPSKVKLNLRVPYFSELGNYYNVEVINSQYTAPSSVSETGLVFQWEKVRWEHTNYIEFKLTVDPQYVLEPGLEYRQISIPIDVSFRRDSRENPPTYDSWFTDLKILAFELHVPESYDELGMDSEVIKDCQLTASSHEGAADATAARPSGTGWSVGEGRGPPLYQNEYIQIDMGGKVKFTGITIYPYNDASAERVTQFKVQYSRKGIRWLDALDSSFQPRVFNVTWPASPTSSSSVLVKFEESEFVGEHIRILPQANSADSYTSKMRFELHGYPHPYGSTLPTYQCPSTADTLKPYVDRQILAITTTLEMFACTISKPGTLPYCSGTDDLGDSWFALDDNVLNVYGYDKDAAFIYGLARDRKTCIRSQDGGHRWKAIDCSRYDTASASASYIAAKTVPFPLAGASKSDLASSYGANVDANHFWTVSEKALHAYKAASISDASSKLDSDGQVAYWGNMEWSGP